MKVHFTWKWLFFVGAILLTTGLSCLLFPFYSYVKLAGYSGALFFLNGIFLLFVIGNGKADPIEKDWLWTESLIHLVFGAFLLFNPLFSFLIFPLILGVWITLLGSIKAVAAVSLRAKLNGWKSIVVIGSFLFLFGLVVLFYPFEKALHFTNLFGVFIILMGIIYFLDAYHFRKKEDMLEMML
jgi:uncharacterized membrane protein HdeD (DUF308 family)